MCVFWKASGSCDLYQKLNLLEGTGYGFIFADGLIGRSSFNKSSRDNHFIFADFHPL